LKSIGCFVVWLGKQEPMVITITTSSIKLCRGQPSSGAI
jgi:hypothetical protein